MRFIATDDDDDDDDDDNDDDDNDNDDDDDDDVVVWEGVAIVGGLPLVVGSLAAAATN